MKFITCPVNKVDKEDSPLYFAMLNNRFCSSQSQIYNIFFKI